MRKKYKTMLQALILISLSPIVWGQAVSNPNEIRGTLTFTNNNPAVLERLNDPSGEGFYRWDVEAKSLYSETHPVIFTNTAEGFVADPTSTPYAITVESGPGGDGISYQMKVSAYTPYTPHLRKYYRFGTITTAPLEELPAPPLIRDFDHCVGLVHLRWVNENDEPANIFGGTLQANQEQIDGSYLDQAGDEQIPGGISESWLVVQGGGNYRLNLIYSFQSGTDPFNDLVLIQESLEQWTPIGCDEIYEWKIVIPDADPGGSFPFGRITGQVEVLGQSLHDISDHFIQAINGPMGNYRFYDLQSVGFFELVNLLPSDYVDPALGYIVSSEFTTVDDNMLTTYRLRPFSDNSNGRKIVPREATVDLGDTFVIDPGTVTGTVKLAGPPPGVFGSPLQHLGNNPVSVLALGTAQKATGATYNTNSSQVITSFPGSYNSITDNYESSYRMFLGGYKREPGLWKTNLIQFTQNRRTGVPDESYFWSGIQIINELFAEPLEIEAGDIFEVPHEYCLSKVVIDFRSGIPFYQPRLSGDGSFEGIDFQDNPAHYNIRVLSANGTPAGIESATTNGLVVTALPQGSYNLRPVVTSVNSDGSTSNTQLPPLDFEVGCRQEIFLSTEIQINLEPLPACSDQANLTLSGMVNSVAPVSRISAQVNETSYILCEDCGVDPSFNGEVLLESGQNNLLITAEDSFGSTATINAGLSYDDVAPLIQGCQDVEVTLPQGETAIPVNFAVSAHDAVDGEVTVNCTPTSGSLFPAGTTEVICEARDACGNLSTCSFTVTVSDCGGAVPDSYTTDCDTPLDVPAPGVLINDCDPEGLPLETHLLTGVSSGYLSLRLDGSFTYFPVPGCTGPVDFVYKAWNGLGYTTATVTIELTPGNAAPLAVDDSYTVTAGTMLTVPAPGVLANDSDPEGDPLVSYPADQPIVGHLGFHQDGSFWYVAPAGYNGSVSFNYDASDGLIKSRATVTLHIQP